MKWQDAALTVCSIVFIIGLAPMLWHEHKPLLSTSIPTALALYVTATAEASLLLLFAAVTTFITATMWLTLALQKSIRRTT